MRAAFLRRLAFAAVLFVPACSEDAATEPLAPTDGDIGDAFSDAGDDVTFAIDTGGSTDGATCGDAGVCPSGTLCRYGTCIPVLGSCAMHDDCPGDSYCDADGICIPYGVPADKINDPSCKKTLDPGKVAPTVQCEWTDAPEGDTSRGYNLVYTAGYVADLNLDLDPDKLRPSIVMTTFAGSVGTGGRVGMLRVFDGRTCTEQMRIGGPDDPERDLNRPGYGTQWAIGDLDGDVATGGHPEIVGLGRVGTATSSTEPLTVIAFSIDAKTDPAKPKLVRKFRGRRCDPTDPSKDVLVTFGTNSANVAPGLWDLDDDGVPEIVVDSMVFDAKGCLLNPPAAWIDYLQLGVISTIADADHDGKPELIRYDGFYGWDPIAKKWSPESWFVKTAGHKTGHVAIADLGKWSTLPGHEGEPLPEVAVVSAATDAFEPRSSGTIRVQALDGTIVFGPIPPFHKYDGVNDTTNYGGHGGPPTIGDFDGDGQPEIAAAANQFYVVYDPDCTADGAPLAARPGGKCDRTKVTLPAGVTALPAGILWAKASRDFSSSATGSSIFDFNGDGVAEAVYRDECYLRVYDGPTGDVIFSAPATSGTGYELPVVADVNGNFATQIVVPRAGNVTGCPATDPLFPASGALVPKTGFVILRDSLDRWASSRPIWNQHAYSVTHVRDDGRIPKTSAVARNWETKGLNNFRQNVQGSLGALKLADLTVQLADLSALCAAKSGEMTLSARVCNRGTNPVTDGVTVEFTMRDKADAGEAGAPTSICTALTPKLLAPGDCTTVSCTGTIDASRDVHVAVDPTGKVADCHPGNNLGASALVLCPTVK
ncbi:MAG: hypothetical protein HYV09_32305 [Deltaproteobacteria bacterium]|nr:hypothetical protein [Deltaproteobacteria bacterium]